MDSSRSHEPHLYRAGPPSSTSSSSSSSTYPYENGQQPPKRTSPSIQPQGPGATYPYDQQARQQQRQQQPPPRQPPSQQRVPPAPPSAAPAPRRNRSARRFLGVLAFLVLTGFSLPLHIGAIFFIYVEFESPGDPVLAALLIGGAFVGSFVALLLTGLIAQKVGDFPGRWRARISFAAFSGIIALAVAYFAALTLF